jgi:hypothetical protein
MAPGVRAARNRVAAWSRSPARDPWHHPRRSELRDAHLLQQGQVVLDVPIVDDPVISTFTRSVAMNSVGRPFPCVWPNLRVKWQVNFIWIGNVIAGDDHLFDPHCQVGHRGAELTDANAGPSGPCGRPDGRV